MKKRLVVSLVMFFSITILFIALPAYATNNDVIAKINFNYQCPHTTDLIRKALTKASNDKARKVKVYVLYKEYSTGAGGSVLINIPTTTIAVYYYAMSKSKISKLVLFFVFTINENIGEVLVTNPEHLNTGTIFPFLDSIVNRAFDKYLACK